MSDCGKCISKDSEIKFLKRSIEALMGATIAPPVVLSDDALAAVINARNETEAQYRHICGKIYWKV